MVICPCDKWLPQQTKSDSNRIKQAKILESKNYSSHKVLSYSYTKNIVFFHTQCQTQFISHYPRFNNKLSEFQTSNLHYLSILNIRVRMLEMKSIDLVFSHFISYFYFIFYLFSYFSIYRTQGQGQSCDTKRKAQKVLDVIILEPQSRFRGVISLKHV